MKLTKFLIASSLALLATSCGSLQQLASTVTKSENHVVECPAGLGQVTLTYLGESATAQAFIPNNPTLEIQAVGTLKASVFSGIDQSGAALKVDLLKKQLSYSVKSAVIDCKL
jgi:hypothetical protein